MSIRNSGRMHTQDRLPSLENYNGNRIPQHDRHDPITVDGIIVM